MLADGRTVSQVRMPDKTTEVTGFTRLLAPFDLAGVVVTNALHPPAGPDCPDQQHHVITQTLISPGCQGSL